MTKEEALKNLEGAVRQITANADIHDVLKESIETLRVKVEK